MTTLRTKAEIELAPDKPSMLAVNPDGIPSDLKDRPQWVAWRSERRKVKKTGEMKWTKVPINPKTGSNADPTDSGTWGTFAEALLMYRSGRCDGVGYVFSADDPFVGIDFDDAIDPVDGTVTEWAAADIALLNSYTEVSPSNTGAKAIVSGKKPGTKCKSGNYEIYENIRFFALTGVQFGGAPSTIEDRQAELNELYARVFGKKPKPPPAPSQNGDCHHSANGHAKAESTTRTLNPENDDDLLTMARIAANGENFISLYDRGEIPAGKSHSEAQAALLVMLAFWTRKDAARMDRLFRASALMNPKWDERRRDSTLGADDIDAAIEFCTKVYGPNDDDGDEIHLTDTGNGKRLVERYGNVLRYVHPWKKPLVWDLKRWALDDTAVVPAWAKETIAHHFKRSAAQIESIGKQLAEAASDDLKDKLTQRLKLVQKLMTHWLKSESAERIKAMIQLAMSEPSVPILPAKLDTDPYLLNVLNGTIDLRTGKLREYRQTDYITKLSQVTYDPNAKAPLWDDFLTTIFNRNVAIISYVRRLVGYCLTGNVSEQILPIFWGAGANGKSTLLNVLVEMLGIDYSMNAVMDLLMVKRGESHPTERADLFGKRLVVCNETEDGRRLAEVLVKTLTGGDRIRARRMREDLWEFNPTHKIIVCGNHKPTIRGQDYAIWRRIRLIPFCVTIPPDQQDKHLLDKLRLELPGVLAWAVEGCIEWQRDGLQTPDEVMAATDEYRREEDALEQFISDRCVIGPEFRSQSTVLFMAYQDHTGDHITLQRKFGIMMREYMERHGYAFEKYTNNGSWYRGIGINPLVSRDDDDFVLKTEDRRYRPVNAYAE